MVVAMAGGVSRQRQRVTSHLSEGDGIVREKPGHERISLSDAHQRRMAAVHQAGGFPHRIGTHVGRSTILTRHRLPVARKYDAIGRFISRTSGGAEGRGAIPWGRVRP